MNKLKLKKAFIKAKLEGKDIAIELTVPSQKENEIIIVQYNNLDYKLSYYINNYDEQLILNKCKDIKIINIFVINHKIIKEIRGEK